MLIQIKLTGLKKDATWKDDNFYYLEAPTVEAGILRIPEAMEMLKAEHPEFETVTLERIEGHSSSWHYMPPLPAEPSLETTQSNGI